MLPFGAEPIAPDPGATCAIPSMGGLTAVAIKERGEKSGL